MKDLNEKVLKLREEGKSLREIARALGISHVAVLKRLKTAESNNQLVTEKTPSLRSDDEVTTPSKGPRDDKKGVFLEVDGLMKEIKDLLEARGIEVCRLKSEPVAYQVKHNGQVIRFYVQGKGCCFPP
jgi:predicted transcriptional regulator